MKLTWTVLSSTMSLLPALAMAAEHSPLVAFPEPTEGMVRFVIPLPEMQSSEDNYSVEIIAGRMIETDGVNQVGMDTELHPQPLEGWGYTYYEMTGSGQVASTLMAPPPGTEKVETFVHGKPLRVRYNSRLPIVVYTPDGFEIRYRIWAAAAEYIPGREG
jgi:ecotin